MAEILEQLIITSEQGTFNFKSADKIYKEDPVHDAFMDALAEDMRKSEAEQAALEKMAEEEMFRLAEQAAFEDRMMSENREAVN